MCMEMERFEPLNSWPDSRMKFIFRSDFKITKITFSRSKSPKTYLVAKETGRILNPK